MSKETSSNRDIFEGSTLSKKLILIWFLATGVAFYAIAIYGFKPLGEFVHPDMRENFRAHAFVIYAHAFGASVALLLGPLQFWPALRRRNVSLHRWMGRAYLGIGVLVGGIAGLFMAFWAYGGWVARSGFATLAVLWLVTGVQAYRAIRRGDIANHRRWMLRNFSLTFAAVTLRIYLPLSMVSGLPFATAYAAIAWLAWLPNLIWVEFSQRTGGNSPGQNLDVRINRAKL